MQQTARRIVRVRLASGDAAGLTATVALAHGDQTGTLHLHSGRPAGEWAYDVPAGERLPGHPPGWTGFRFSVEYAWGYAREASFSGERDGSDEELVLPLPDPATDGSFPFPRRH